MGNSCQSLSIFCCLIPVRSVSTMYFYTLIVNLKTLKANHVDDDQEFDSICEQKRILPNKQLDQHSNNELNSDGYSITSSFHSSSLTEDGLNQFDDREISYFNASAPNCSFNFDHSSFDSGFNTSINILTSSWSDLATLENESSDHRQLVTVGYSVEFDTVLTDYLNSRTKIDFRSGFEPVINLPSVLKNAFISWSKSSLRRLGHTVLKLFLNPRIGFLQHQQFQTTTQIVSTDKTYQCRLNLLNNLLISFNNQSDWVLKFYSHYCCNFC